MSAVFEKQSRELYEKSAKKMVSEITGEDTETEIIFSDGDIEKVVIHKNVPEKRADIAAALGIFPSKVQMTE